MIRLRFALLGLVPMSARGQTAPIPRIDSTGRALTFSFPGLRIGVAEYEEGPTGTTVFYFPKGVKAAVDVRGGAPGTINTDAVRLGYESAMMQAVVFSGGSWYGLSAATGVGNAIKEIRAAQGDHDFVAGILAAIIYDVGNRRYSRVTPDDRLGQAALRSAREGWFPQGARGAGRFAMQGGFFLDRFTPDRAADWPHSGQGGAVRDAGATRIAVFTVVNALGAVVDREGHVVRCHRNTARPECPSIAAMIRDRLARAPARSGDADAADGPASGPSGNTTLTLVVTNRKLAYWALQRLAVQVHTSMARAIQPFATAADGDVLYAVTTDEVDDPSMAPDQLAAVASEVAWDAVLASVPDLAEPPPAAGASTERRADRELVGTFLFPDGGKLSISSDSDGLGATFTGNGRIYFEGGRRYRLVPIGPERFVVDGTARDVLQFERGAGKVTGVTLNPGRWHQLAALAGDSR